MRSRELWQRRVLGNGPKVMAFIALGGLLSGALVGMRLNASSAEAQEAAILAQVSKNGLDFSSLSEVDVLGREAVTGDLIVRAMPKLLHQIATQGFKIYSEHEPVAEGLGQNSQIESYFTPEQLNAKLYELQVRYPDLLTLEEAGKTRQGRPILAAVLQRNSDSTEARPTVLFNGMHHARELMTAEVGFSIVEKMLQGAESDPEVNEWLNKYRIVVIPQVNPDGNNLVHNGNRYWRKNAWTEKNNVIGVDLNRNYPSLWGACNGSSGSKSSDTYRGPSAGSEPEAQALMNTVKKYRPVFDISYHSFSELIIYPFGCENVDNPAKDFFADVAGQMNANIVNDEGKTGGYDVGTAPELLYNADGSDLDWQWTEFGVYAYTIEINSSRQGFQPSYAQWRNKTVENQQGGWKTLIRRLDGPGVRGHLRSAAILTQDRMNLDDVTYTIEQKTSQGLSNSNSVFRNSNSVFRNSNSVFRNSNSVFRPFAPVPVHNRKSGQTTLENKRFKLRNSEGFFFQMLQPGSYRARFWNQETLLKEVEFNVAEGISDLGEIELLQD